MLTIYSHNSGGEVENMSDIERYNLLNSYTLYNNGNGPDPYAYVTTPDGIRASYNPVLSCLRSFGLLEAIFDNILYMATQPLYESSNPVVEEDLTTLNSTDYSLLETILEGLFNNTKINADESIGFTMDITSELFQKLKWYESEVDEDLYGPTM